MIKYLSGVLMSRFSNQEISSEPSIATSVVQVEPAADELGRDVCGGGDPLIRILGVDIVNLGKAAAIKRLRAYLCADEGKVVYFVNAHTLNLAVGDPEFRLILNNADLCLGDGIGIRLAAASRGVRMLANLNGTDLVPALLAETSEGGHRYFLLGLDESSIERASKQARELFPGWTLAGYHHGYVDQETSEQVIECINASKSQLLLVGMGNPLQEFWVSRYRHRLRVSLSLGVGGLIDYWAGNLERAPLWMRKWGLEWLFILCQQPRKFRRYILGNPLFIARMLAWRGCDRRQKNKVV